MKVIGIEIARSAQLFVPDEVKPRKGMYFPDLVRRTKARYEFVTAPEQPSNEGAKFLVGRFFADDVQINISDLTIYNDGVVVEAPTTEDANIVLDDFIPWIQTELDIGDITTKWPRSYVSGIVVEFERSLDREVRLFSHFDNLLARAYEEAYKFKLRIAIDRLTFGSDAMMPKPIIGRDFTIERRIETTQADNRFYSSSSFPTKTHVDLLRQFEKLLG